MTRAPEFLTRVAAVFVGAWCATPLAAEELFDLKAIRDPSTLAVEVLQDWTPVDGRVPTRQKLVTIRVGEIWPGQEYRVPVRMVVPADRKAKGFHLTGGNTPPRLKSPLPISPLEAALLEGGVGLVATVVQEPRSMGLDEIGRETERRFLATLDPRVKVQYWAWPATMMRAATAALAETGHFEAGGKIAMSGGSKNGASPSMAILHDDRLTAVHATVSPIWDSPLRLCDRKAWDALQAEVGEIRHPFLGGHYGPNFNRRALEAGRSWDELKQFAAQVSDEVFLSRHLEALRDRGVEFLFHPGTHDFVCYDLAWGGAHHPDIPIYLGANSGHGIREGHPDAEKGQANRDAFLFRHFFPDEIEPLLEPPVLESEMTAGGLEVMVRFPEGSNEETGRIWWIENRPYDGSPGYLEQLIPGENSRAMVRGEGADGAWRVTIPVTESAIRIDVFTNHRKTLVFRGRELKTYLSSPYTRVTFPR